MSEGKASNAPSFPTLVQQFFTEYLVSQRAMSPYTVAAYRDAMVLFLRFAHQRLGKAPTELSLQNFAPDLILAFLDHLFQVIDGIEINIVKFADFRFNIPGYGNINHQNWPMFAHFERTFDRSFAQYR